MTAPDRFILIDDNEADNVFHEIMIRRAGFTGDIIVFESGFEALSFLQADALTIPTCIYLDINMPLMDGFEFALEATPLLADKSAVVLLMLTSSDSPRDRARVADIPLIQGFVTKPLLADTVRNMLQRG
ncbi:MAG: response regulator [Hydrogenophaga sp.]|uniref:response regulator n=1 Tax=Hydrogenophaga sp. TaxID=1904254 RepID=UPI00260B2D39|nr:response regulator [Hydrogenophaga sp.]MDM7943018.1 response regulator [Hydrogenophaga sp.]